MAKVTVVAKVTAKAEAVEAVRGELLKMVAPTRAEDGCLEYRLHQDNSDPTVFIFYENWQDMTCLERHMKSAHFQAYVAAVGDLLADKAVHLLTEAV